MILADNAVIRRENVVENRRGYAVYGTLSGAPSQFLTYNKKILAHHGSALSYDNGSGTFSDYSGSYTAPAGSKIRGVEARSNLYFTTSEGVKVFTDTAGTAARRAGAPRALDPSYALNAGVTGFLAAGSQCAYRVVIQRTDANGNVLYGYPSTRLVVYNTAGTTKNVDLTLYLPAEVTTSDIIQFYRTEQVAGTSEDASGDEMKLVYQVSPTGADISNKYLTFTDSITDELRGASLYTSPSQEGITQANDRPPLCKDMALYRSAYLFYANTSTKQRLNLSLVGTSSLSGKSITIAGTSYTFDATEDASTGKVQVSASGVAAVAIDETARSLVRVINRYSSNTSVYAYYLSGPDDLPGQILIEERGVGAAAFTVLAGDTSISAMFFPPPPVGTPNEQSTSSNSVQKNALFYSKSQEPEHVPALNYILVGPANTDILRVAALRDSLIIIKEEGVYRLTGETPQNFSVVPLDLTVSCKAADSVATLANQILMLSNQGVVGISDTGVQIISREIEPSLLPLLSLSNLADNAYGIAYESDRSYLLSTLTAVTDTEPSQTFVYNVFTKTWTRYTFPFTAGIVENTADRLYFSKPGESFVYRERKDFAFTDYADPEVSCTVTDISGDQVTVTLPGSTTPLAGWVIEQGSTRIAVDEVEAVSGGFVLTLALAPPADFALGDATLYPGIAMSVVYDSWSGGQPALLKRILYFAVLTDNVVTLNTNGNLSATFYSDTDTAVDEVPISGTSYSWDSSPWGSFPWGGTSDGFARKCDIPRNKHYARLLNPGIKHKNAFEKVSINGISLHFEHVSPRIMK